MVDDSGGDLVLGPAQGSSHILHTDCDPSPTLYEDPYVVGFSSDGSVSTYGQNGCPPTEPVAGDESYFATCIKKGWIGPDSEEINPVERNFKFRGVEGNLDRYGDIPTPTPNGDTSAWVGLSLCGDEADRGWLQVGIGRVPGDVTKVFWQTKLPGSLNPVTWSVNPSDLAVPSSGARYKAYCALGTGGLRIHGCRARPSHTAI